MALGSYNDFIRSMLSLREQRLQEERYKQLERMEQQEQMSKMIQGMGQQFGSMAETMGQNKIANQLGQEYFGGAADEGGIRGGSMGSAYSQPGVGGTGGTGGWGGGGMAELKLRMGMDELSNKRLKESIASGNEAERIRIAQAHLGLAETREGRVGEAEATRLENAEKTLGLREEAAARAQEAAALRLEQKQVDDAMKTYQATSTKYKEYKTGASAFNKQIPVTMKAIQHSVDAGDQEGYLNAISELDAHYQAATSQGLKVQMPKIASFEELLAAKAKQAEIDAANAGYYFSTKAQEQAEAAKFQKELQGMPGYLQHPSRINPENYLATPPIEEPVVPDLEALRAQARANPAAGASAAAPATGLNVGQGARAQASMSAAEYKAKTGEDVAPGTVKVDAKGRRLLITP